MRNRDIVLEYLRCFCSGDIPGVEAVLASEFRLAGPLFKFDSRDGYVESLKQDPPEPSRYEVIDIAESDAGISVFYEYKKESGEITIAQFFKLREGKISEMLLAFDTKDVS